MKSKNEIQSAFENLISSTDDEKLEIEASSLALRFLSEIDEAMCNTGLLKKDLAKVVNTSPSYITQLFRGDRKPNWLMIVKMAQAVNITFHITTLDKYEEETSTPKGDLNGMWYYKPYRIEEADEVLSASEFNNELSPIAV